MKNSNSILGTLILVLLINLSLSAQVKHSSSPQNHSQPSQKVLQHSANCLQQGNVIVDAFYGFPYFNGSLLGGSSSNASSTHIHNYNQLGAKVEYMASDKIGIGLEGTYALATANYQGNDLNFYKEGISKFRILGKINFHFGTTEHFDPYVTFGTGYKNSIRYSNEPERTQHERMNVTPIAFRAGIGMRYFFNDVVGVNAEMGIGGPLMQAGISLKF